MRFLCNNINVIFRKLIIFEVFAQTAKLDHEPQKFIHAECTIVKGFPFEST